MVDIVELSNGLKVVMESIPFIRSISFGIFVKNGSRNEDENTNGISHFIEHMLFKATENRSAKQIAEEMDAIGGQINAYTTKEYTCYYTKTLDTHFDIAIDILSDMFFNSKFDDTEIKKERNVILEEINMYEDAPEDLVYDELQFNVWKSNPIGYPILGTKKTISSFKSKTFKKYFTENYCPSNTVLSIAGNFNKDEMIKKIEKYFKNWKEEKKYSHNLEEVIYNPCIIKKEKDIEQMHLCIAFPGIPLGDEAAYTLVALNTIFGGGMSSRLFQRIREENGLAYSVYSYCSNYKDTGLFTVYSGLNPLQIKSVINLILDEIKLLHTNKVTEEQLYKTKEQMKSNFILSLESSSNRMSSMGRSMLLLERILSTDELIKKIDDITIKKIDELTKRMFVFDNISASLVGKVNDVDLKELIINGKK